MAVVFDSVGFSAALDSLKTKVSDKLKSELKNAVTEEAKSQLDGKNPNDAQAYTNFYNRVMPADNFKKNIIPEEVYKAIMLEAAVRDENIRNGINIDELKQLDGKTVSAISSWFQGIFGKKTITVGIFNKKTSKTDEYKVTMKSNFYAQVEFPNKKTYSVTWTLDDTAEKALKDYIADLKTYLSDYRYQIYGEIIKDGLTPLINEFIAEVAEGVDSAREKLINGFHEWALNKAADVAIDKILPKTYKQIKAVEKNYKAFVSKLNDLKTYAGKVSDDSIKNNKKYTAFVTAYNKLGIGNYVDVVADYLSYEFLETVGGVFDQSKALITGTNSDNEISASGSYVTIKGGGGNDFISASGLKSRISGDAGNDKVLLKSSQGSISGGAGSDSIVVDGERNTVLGGANDDYIALFKGKNTITGGTGNDTIFFVGVGESVIKYKSGDGNDTIIGYDSTDTIKITGNYSMQTSEQDVIITVGNGSIRLVGASGKKININNTEKTIGKLGDDNEVNEYTLPSGFDTVEYVKYGTNGDDEIYNYHSNVLIITGTGNDFIGNTGSWNSKLQKSVKTDNVTISSGAGNDTIQNGDRYNEGGSNVEINGGADNDSISNYGDNVTINGGDGDDFLANKSNNWDSYFKKYDGADNVKINGGAGNDYIKNDSQKVTINAGAGNDNISNIGYNVTIDGGTDNDYIYNGGGNSSISGGTGNDSIYNGNSNVTIDSGTGNDYIENSGENVLFNYASGDGNDVIYGFKANSTLQIGNGNNKYYQKTVIDDLVLTVGNDSITLKGAASLDSLNIIGKLDKSSPSKNLIFGTDNNDSIIKSISDATITALKGNDTVQNYAEKVTINSGDGDDYVYNSSLSANTSISNEAGNDSIRNYGSTVTIDSGAGNDDIDNSGSFVTIDGGAGNDILTNGHYWEKEIGGANVSLYGGSGKDTIKNWSTSSIIDGGANGDYINNGSLGANVTIKGGDGDDSIVNLATSISIDGGSGKDTIKNWGANVTINSGDGNDYIDNIDDNVLINSGAGNDSIYNQNPGYDSNVSINAGKGNDYINCINPYNTTTNKVLFEYTSGDGNDIIYGSNATSTLRISGAKYSTTKSGDDVIVTVGDGKISLMGAARYNVNIIRQVSTTTLTNKNSAKITIGADIDVADASKRTKAIKIVGNTFDNTILGGSKSDSLYGGKGANSLIGNAGNDKLYGQAGNDILKGGAGNDSLWGGAGNDTLWGDTGTDTFIYSTGEGKDVIYGFENDDLLKITGAFNGTYSKSKSEVYFKVGTTSKAITLTDFSATSFNINGTNYKISGTKLVKK